MNVPTDISFDTGSADFKPSMRPTLDGIGRTLDGTVRVMVVGHTDSTGGDAGRAQNRRVEISLAEPQA